MNKAPTLTSPAGTPPVPRIRGFITDYARLMHNKAFRSLTTALLS